jgi:isopentenyldiphosphate isomerase
MGKDEVYDVVDEQGTVLRTATWTECHQQGLLHQTAAVLLFRDETKQEVLIQRRSMQMKQKPGLLQHSASGHILAGDTPEQGARLEVEEELFGDMRMPSLPLRFVTSFFQNDIPNNYEIVYLYETIHSGPFVPSKEEIAGEPFWMRWDALLVHMQTHPEQYTPAAREAMAHYCRAEVLVDATNSSTTTQQRTQ